MSHHASSGRGLRVALVCALAATVVVSLWRLHVGERGIVRETLRFGETPVAVYRREGSAPAPVVLVAHGFAGSRRLMEPVALALADRGYVTVTYDFLGHGRHPKPMRGDLQDQDGTPALLMRQTAEVADAALELPGSDGRLAIVGHSMATNILARFAQEDERVDATVGISTYAPTTDSTSPRNLLVIVGALEGRLEAEGRRVVAMVSGGGEDEVAPFTTYRAEGAGARRLAVSPWVEHVGVLYSATTLDETVRWLDGVYGREAEAPGPPRGRGRGLWIALLVASVFGLARPMARGLPRAVSAPVGADASWRRLAVVAGVPSAVTPLILRPLPTSFLPVVVADYVAVHFFAIGLLTGVLLWWTAGRPAPATCLASARLADGGAGRVLAGAALVVAFFLLLVAWPLDRFFTSFVPGAERLPLLLAILLGTLPYFLADEWLTRGAEARRGAYAFTKLLFLLSLVAAVALDFEALFFLVLIIPVILVFFVVHGMLSRWVYRSTGSPLVAGLANAVAFAWAISVTFPLYAAS